MTARPDPIVICPFNKSHILNKSRLQVHIIKCSRNYPDHFVCPFNSLHRFLTKDEYDLHVILCTDSKLMNWPFEQPTVHGDLSETPNHDEDAAKFNLEEENWTKEYNN